MLRLHIKRRGRVVKHQNLAFLGKRPRNADPLLLSAGKSDTALPDDSLVTVRQTLDEPVRLGQALASSLNVPGDVLEFLYAYGIGGASEVCVVLRSSGGSSLSAFESWMGHILGFDETDEVFRLAPIVRRDALERLARAQGAAKLDMKLEPGFSLQRSGQTQVQRALETVAEELGDGVSIELGISFGRARPSEEDAERLAHEVQKIDEIPTEVIREMIDEKFVEDFRRRALVTRVTPRSTQASMAAQISRMPASTAARLRSFVSFVKASSAIVSPAFSAASRSSAAEVKG